MIIVCILVVDSRAVTGDTGLAAAHRPGYYRLRDRIGTFRRNVPGDAGQPPSPYQDGQRITHRQGRRNHGQFERIKKDLM
jgi:hypothetical protein